MEKCRHCGSERIIKTGHRDGQQKWRCKDCGKFQGEVDRREKYTEKERQTAIDLYLEGCGFRRIARILSGIFNRHVCYQTVIEWKKKKESWLCEVVIFFQTCVFHLLSSKRGHRLVYH